MSGRHICLSCFVYFGEMLGIFLGCSWDMVGIFLGYVWDMLGYFWDMLGIFL